MNQLSVTKEEEALGINLMLTGDVGALNPAQKADLIQRLCRRFNLNPLTQPFAFIKLQGRIQLYALKNCTDQLRCNNGVSITVLDKEALDGVYVVTVQAQMGTRTDTEIGAVSINGLKGEALANAKMKALTKAKRRVTLSICGLSLLDESEIDSIPNATPVDPPIISKSAKPEHSDPIDPQGTEFVQQPIQNIPPDFVESPNMNNPNFTKDYKVPFGKYRGRTLEEIGKEDATNYASYLMKMATHEKPLSDAAQNFIQEVSSTYGA